MPNVSGVSDFKEQMPLGAISAGCVVGYANVIVIEKTLEGGSANRTLVL